MPTVAESAERTSSSPFRRLSKVLDADKFLYVNEENVDEELLCSVCFTAFVEPVIHEMCGVTFCRECVDNQWITTCPSCRGPIRKPSTYKPQQ
mmetsp:Transcript_17515/g.31278  ORF Transcript_17515/g.31278 Transcript_17515/m.31278 type:complete len:93 (+) Transcript_17515:183-461(+)